jgi:heme A synthase
MEDEAAVGLSAILGWKMVSSGVSDRVVSLPLNDAP